MSDENITSAGSEIENFDFSVFDYIDKELNCFCTTINGWSKVPVIFSSPERSFSSKNDQNIRDKNGTLIYPIISIIRKDLRKPKQRSSMFGVNQFKINDFKKNQILVYKEINQIKTAERTRTKSKRFTGGNFNQVEADKIVYNLYYMEQPTTIEIDYIIKIRTNFLTQMNEITSKFLTDKNNINYFVMKRNNHVYEGFIDEDFSNNSNNENMEENERFFETDVKILMRGHIVGNGETPKIIVRESACDVDFSEEFVESGSLDDYISNLNK